MRSSEFASGSVAGWSYGDGNDLAVFDRIVGAYQVGDNTVVAETNDGREIRVTAWLDLTTHEYVTEYERRSVIRSGGREYQVWAHTPAYQRCTAADIGGCLQAALLEVDRTSVY
jgi:hypothetical protein